MKRTKATAAEHTLMLRMADQIATMAAFAINTLVPWDLVPYARQDVLERVIKQLQEKV